MGAKKVSLLARDILDGRIDFMDTGIVSNIGQRLKAMEKRPEGGGEVPGQPNRRPDRPEPQRPDRALPPPQGDIS